MFRKSIFTLGVSLALVAQPLAALEPSGEDIFAELAEAIDVEPLTAEQEARLPLAQAIINKLMPEGAMQEMFDGMMDGALGGLMKTEEQPQAADEFVADQLGLETEDLDISADQAKEMADMFDPARGERKAAEAVVMQKMMGEMMGAMEPLVRQRMAELYAIHFNETELKDVDAFFETPSGAAYARKSFSMTSDPRMAAVSIEAIPSMMTHMEKLGEKIAAATADLPLMRSFAELSGEEKERIAKMTGYDVAYLEEWSMPYAETDEVEAIEAGGNVAEGAAKD